MGRTGRTIAVLGLAGMLGSGCAQPGQLGSPAPEPTPAPPASSVAPTPEPRLPALLGRGLVDYPVQITTPGPAVYSVRAEVLPPGGSTDWHLHPGTETSIVTAGSVTLIQEDGCEPVRYDVGDAAFVGDAVPHVVRNDGAVPAELVVGHLLAPGAPDRVDAPPACPR